jgi:hypothetical protein
VMWGIEREGINPSPTEEIVGAGFSPALESVSWRPCARAAQRRHFLSLGREPQDQGSKSENKPRSGDRWTATCCDGSHGRTSLSPLWGSVNMRRRYLGLTPQAKKMSPLRGFPTPMPSVAGPEGPASSESTANRPSARQPRRLPHKSGPAPLWGTRLACRAGGWEIRIPGSELRNQSAVGGRP